MCINLFKCYVNFLDIWGYKSNQIFTTHRSLVCINFLNKKSKPSWLNNDEGNVWHLKKIMLKENPAMTSMFKKKIFQHIKQDTQEMQANYLLLKTGCILGERLWVHVLGRLHREELREPERLRGGGLQQRRDLYWRGQPVHMRMCKRVSLSSAYSPFHPGIPWRFGS